MPFLKYSIRKEHSPLKGTDYIPKSKHNFSIKAAQDPMWEKMEETDLNHIWGGDVALSFH